MIKGCRDPGTGDVAIVAAGTTLDVICRFARGRNAIVTTDAGTGNHVMVHSCKRLPELICVAFLT
jgi:hypothetical protein